MLLQKNKVLGFAIIWYLSGISLFSNFLFPVGVPMAERFLFLPSVGFCVIVAMLLEKWLVKEKTIGLNNYKLMATIIPILALYGFKTFIRNSDWKDNLTLFEKDGKTLPNNARLAYYCGTELTKSATSINDINKQIELLQQAVIKLHTAINIYPEFELAFVQLGSTYFSLKKNDSAEYYNLRALKLNNFNSLTHYNIAGVYFSKKNYIASKQHCVQAIQLKPEWADAYTSLALCYIQMNNTDSCIYNLYKSINLNPDNKRAYEILYMVYDNIGEMDSVKKYRELAFQ
jgi:tetratricopeptide (TPR) repeat protein